MILSGKQSSQTGNDGGTDTPRPKFTSLTSLPGNDGFKFEAPKAIHVNILSDTNEGSIVGFVVFRDTPDDSLTLADLREAIKSQFDSDQLEALGGGDRFKFLQNAIPISKKQEKDIQISECHDIQGVKHKMSLASRSRGSGRKLTLGDVDTFNSVFDEPDAITDDRSHHQNHDHHHDHYRAQSTSPPNKASSLQTTIKLTHFNSAGSNLSFHSAQNSDQISISNNPIVPKVTISSHPVGMANRSPSYDTNVPHHYNLQYLSGSGTLMPTPDLLQPPAVTLAASNKRTKRVLPKNRSTQLSPKHAPMPTISELGSDLGMFQLTDQAASHMISHSGIHSGNYNSFNSGQFDDAMDCVSTTKHGMGYTPKTSIHEEDEMESECGSAISGAMDGVAGMNAMAAMSGDEMAMKQTLSELVDQSLKDHHQKQQNQYGHSQNPQTQLAHAHSHPGTVPNSSTRTTTRTTSPENIPNMNPQVIYYTVIVRVPLMRYDGFRNLQPVSPAFSPKFGVMDPEDIQSNNGINGIPHNEVDAHNEANEVHLASLQPNIQSSFSIFDRSPHVAKGPNSNYHSQLKHNLTLRGSGKFQRLREQLHSALDGMERERKVRIQNVQGTIEEDGVYDGNGTMDGAGTTVPTNKSSYGRYLGDLEKDGNHGQNERDDMDTILTPSYSAVGTQKRNRIMSDISDMALDHYQKTRLEQSFGGKLPKIRLNRPSPSLAGRQKRVTPQIKDILNRALQYGDNQRVKSMYNFDVEDFWESQPARDIPCKFTVIGRPVQLPRRADSMASATSDITGERTWVFTNPTDMIIGLQGVRHSREHPVWMDLCCDAETFLIISEHVRPALHGLTIEDCVTDDCREKLELFEDYLFCCIRTTMPEEERLTEKICIMMFKTMIITYHTGGVGATVVNAAKERLEKRHLVKCPSPGWVAHTMIDVVIDRMMPEVECRVQEVQNVESLVFQLGTSSQEELLQRIQNARSWLMVYRSRLWPKSTLAHKFVNIDWRGFLDGVPQQYWNDINDHVAEMVELLGLGESTLETAQDIFVAKISVEMADQSNQLSHSTARLENVGSIFLPLTFFAGLWGMNCKVPFQYTGAGDEELFTDDYYGFIMACSLIIVSAVFTYRLSCNL